MGRSVVQILSLTAMMRPSMLLLLLLLLCSDLFCTKNHSVIITIYHHKHTFCIYTELCLIIAIHVLGKKKKNSQVDVPANRASTDAASARSAASGFSEMKAFKCLLLLAACRNCFAAPTRDSIAGVVVDRDAEIGLDLIEA